MNASETIEKQNPAADPVDVDTLRTAYHAEYRKRRRVELALIRGKHRRDSLNESVNDVWREVTAVGYEDRIVALKGEIETLKAERDKARNESHRLTFRRSDAAEALAAVEAALDDY